jgi:hypothetical protein
MRNDKIYHIYVKNKCLYHSLSETEFEETWKMIHNFLSVANCSDIDKKDINYEELSVSKEIILNSSH